MLDVVCVFYLNIFSHLRLSHTRERVLYNYNGASLKNDDINKFLVINGKRMCQMVERRDAKDSDMKGMIPQ